MGEPEIPGYQIQEVIGKGGMGVVYRARQVALDRIVALKVLNPDFSQDREFVDSFAQEAKTVAKLHHPNIVSVYDFGSHEGLYYLSMQYVQGRTLRELMHTRRPSMEECASILVQVADALDYAHREEVIHRDIKPGNIMLSPDGKAMVMDFGVACGSHAGDMSSIWMAVGTPNYMSPEQCKGRKASPRSDQYSVGVVAYEMLAGHLPFVAREPLAVMQMQLTQSPPALRLGRTDITPRTEAAVMRALSKLPEVRFESVGAFARELEAASREAPAAEMLVGAAAGGRSASGYSGGPVSLTGEASPLTSPSSSTSRQAYPNAPMYAVRGTHHHPRQRSFWGWMVVLVLFAAMGTGAYFLYLQVSGPTASDRAKIAAPAPSSPRGSSRGKRRTQRTGGRVVASPQPRGSAAPGNSTAKADGQAEPAASETTTGETPTPPSDSEEEKPKPPGEGDGEGGGAGGG